MLRASIDGLARTLTRLHATRDLAIDIQAALRQALLTFKETYNREWLIARLGYRSPAQARQAFALEAAA